MSFRMWSAVVQVCGAGCKRVTPKENCSRTIEKRALLLEVLSAVCPVTLIKIDDFSGAPRDRTQLKIARLMPSLIEI